MSKGIATKEDRSGYGTSLSVFIDKNVTSQSPKGE
jgi:hypothetical protein